ncbi:hypothetical protein [Actinoplanes sp. G11-F43]|uniref:hypothetical protein n=1 Tax=Actinoplanes sp. G11-F43 TaxID=3424130 RepID=UPI003D34E62F
MQRNHLAWLHIRRIRYPGLVGRVPLEDLCDVLDGRRDDLPADRSTGLGDRLPDGARPTLVSWADDAPAVLVNYALPDERRVESASWAGDAVISGGCSAGSPRTLAVHAG